MRAHIAEVMGRYREKIDRWDVVNEAINEKKEGSILRPSKWFEILGEDYIADAFRAAHEADPDARLVYNDFNLALASVLALFASSPAQAQILIGNANDAELAGDSTVQNINATSLQVGRSAAAPNVRAAYFIFDLTGVGTAAAGTQLSLYYSGETFAGTNSAKLQAVGYSASASTLPTGYTGGGTTGYNYPASSVLLSSNFVNTATTPGQYLNFSGTPLNTFINNNLQLFPERELWQSDELPSHPSGRAPSGYQCARCLRLQRIGRLFHGRLQRKIQRLGDCQDR